MEEKQELLQYLSIVEMKLQSLIQDIKNIKSRLEPVQMRNTNNNAPTFFTALQADDDAFGNVSNGF